MSWALCFHCGEQKFGAWCPCRKCGASSSGGLAVAMAFSTQCMSRSRLAQFGAVVKALRSVSDDQKLCFWAFLLYVSENHPNILEVKIPEGQVEGAKNLLGQAKLPYISPKRWWEFWK